MRRVAVVLLVLLALAACGDDGEDVGAGDGGATEPAATDDLLAGRTFAVTEADGDRPIVAGSTITFDFTGDALRVDSGCNAMGGRYTVEGETLVVTDFSKQEAGCPPGLDAQEAWVVELLTTPTQVATTDEGITLSTDGDVVTLTEVVLPPTELVGPTWTVDTLIDGDTASSVPAGVTATVAFDADGGFRLDTGCNGGEGTYATPDGGDSIIIEEVAVELAGCDDERGTVEEAVLSTLQGTLTVSIADQRLTLTAADGSGLGFTAT
jgi:heat shock protein HslJ